MSELFAPVCSITSTQRRRFFWAAWWSGPPTRTPFRRPDASDGGAATWDEALAEAERRAGTKLTSIEPLWARAWMRILRGGAPWPSAASSEPRAQRSRSEPAPAGSIWATLGIASDATASDIKAAYRRRARETHPDHGGDAAAFQRVLQAYEEALTRHRRPKRKR
jgi:hypothetical protein